MTQRTPIALPSPWPPAPPPGKMTYEEFLAWAPDGLHAEWVNGKAIVMSPSNLRHQDLAGFLAAILRVFVERHSLGRILAAPYQMKGYGDLPGREPDLIFVAAEGEERLVRTHLQGPADLAIEIVSPESRSRDRVEKFGEYQQAGVREYWIIDPERREADFYALDSDGAYQALPVDARGVVLSAVLPGVWLRMDWLWREPLPPLMEVLKAWDLI